VGGDDLGRASGQKALLDSTSGWSETNDRPSRSRLLWLLSASGPRFSPTGGIGRRLMGAECYSIVCETAVTSTLFHRCGPPRQSWPTLGFPDTAHFEQEALLLLLGDPRKREFNDFADDRPHLGCRERVEPRAAAQRKV
jgi:hypothetical protein